MIGLSSIFQKDSFKIKGLLLGFVIVYHGFLIYSLKNGPVDLRDSQEYKYSASNFETERNFYAGPQESERDFRLYSKRTPLYPLVLHGIAVINLHRNYIYVFQIFIGLCSIVLAFIFISKFVKNTFLSCLFLSIFLMFTPSQFIYSQFIMADLWLQFFVMLCVFSFLRLYKSKHFGWLIGLIIFSTCAVLTKPVFLLASSAISLFCLVYILKNKINKWVILFTILPIASWTWVCNKNNKLTGVYHYSSIGYINLLHYNTNLFLQNTQGQSEAKKLLEPLMMVPHSKEEFKNNYEAVNVVCRETIRANIIGYLVFHVKGMVYFFLDPGRFDLYQFFRIEPLDSVGFLNHKPNRTQLLSHSKSHPMLWIYMGFIFFFNGIKTIGFFGFIWRHRKNHAVVACAALVFYLAFLTGPLGASRFALPVGLIIMSGAALFYAELFKKAKDFS